MAVSCKVAQPTVLILASRFDFTCDFIVAALRRRSASYVRLNSEDMADWVIELDPSEPRCRLRFEGSDYSLESSTLRSVVFRRPVYLRDYGDDQRSPEERFARIQWASFMQNLEVFEQASWFNSPTSTYRAEHKMVQLNAAKSVGMDIPPTRVTNDPASVLESIPGPTYIIKGLDTVMIRDSGHETFGFTTVASASELEGNAWRAAPTTIQWRVPDKVDVRVTVVGDAVFAASILQDGRGVSHDWRLHKDSVQFRRYQLPAEIEDQCRALVDALGLRFGAIDLAISGDRYYFLEVNPTGEWAWLVDAAGLPIDEAFGEQLCG